MSDDGLMRSAARRVTVEPALFLFMLASFIEYGTYLDLLYYKVCYVEYGDHRVCSEMSDEVRTFSQTHGSLWMLYNNFALLVPSILVASYVGRWSDEHGRKLPMLLSAFSTLLGYLIYMFAAHFRDAPVVYLLVANLVTGLGGGFVVFIASVMSYLVDVSAVEDRTSRVAVLESMTFLGATLGPLVSGYLLEATNYVYVFLLCLACNSAVIVYIVFRIDDGVVHVEPTGLVNSAASQLQPSSAMPAASTRGFNFGSIYEGFMACFKEREGRKKIYVLMATLAFICVILASAAENDVLFLYVKDAPLSWKYLTYSQYQSVNKGLGTALLLFGLPLMRRYLHLRDSTLVFMGLLSRAAGLILLTVSTTTTMMFCVPLVALFAIFPAPCYRSMLSKLVDSTEQGQLFSMLATVENIFVLIGSLIFNQLYPLTRHILHGLCFLVGAGFVACACLLTSFSVIDQRRHVTRNN